MVPSEQPDPGASVVSLLERPVSDLDAVEVILRFRARVGALEEELSDLRKELAELARTLGTRVDVAS